MNQPIFYCQLDYGHIPYPSPVDGHGNIADNGCGVCAISMVAENLLGTSFPPEDAAEFALQCGARADVGTNLYILSKAFAERFNLDCIETEDAYQALEFLNKQKGIVIANVRGDRPDDGYKGCFSDCGHYIVVIGSEGRDVHVLDPMYRVGRYDTPDRRGKVRMEGNVAVADISVLQQDCVDRPFFLFSRKD